MRRIRHIALRLPWLTAERRPARSFGRRRVTALLLACSTTVPLLLAAAPAANALSTRTLLLSQRFTPTSAPESSAFATDMLALRGETEGLQVAALAEGSVLRAQLGANSDPFFTGHVRFLRVGFVNIARPTSKQGSQKGMYADPLPPQTASASLVTTPGQWAGFVVLVDVPGAAAPGAYAGAVELIDAAGAVAATVPIQLRVSTVNVLPRTDKAAFQAYVGVTWRYERQLPSANRELLLANLYRFLEQQRMAPTAFGYGRPERSGAYDSAAAAKLGEYQGFGFASHMIPLVVSGFDLSSAWKKGSGFLRNLAAHWRARGYLNRNTVAWLWDEPGAGPEHKAIPGMNRLIHKNFPGVKTMVTTTPRETTPTRRLKAPWGTNYVVPGEKYSNTNLWNGGPDDLDIINVPTHRFYGRYSSKIETIRHIDNSRVVWNRLQKIRKKGKEVWSYSYFMPTAYIPQRAIDGPPTDSRLLFNWQAFEDNRGWLLWDVARWTAGKQWATQLRNPYDDPVSFQLPKGEVVNGEASLIYPGFAPRYGLNDPSAAPVSSLRMESMRDGIEDVDLVTRYRQRFGDKAVKARYAKIFGGLYTLPGTGFVWQKYSNVDMARRLEENRRAMITQLEAAGG